MMKICFFFIFLRCHLLDSFYLVSVVLICQHFRHRLGGCFIYHIVFVFLFCWSLSETSIIDLSTFIPMQIIFCFVLFVSAFIPVAYVKNDSHRSFVYFHLALPGHVFVLTNCSAFLGAMFACVVTSLIMILLTLLQVI